MSEDNWEPALQPPLEVRPAPAAADPLAEALRGFGPIGLLAILVISPAAW